LKKVLLIDQNKGVRRLDSPEQARISNCLRLQLFPGFRYKDIL